jgi:hypothetical protein
VIVLQAVHTVHPVAHREGKNKKNPLLKTSRKRPARWRGKVLLLRSESGPVDREGVFLPEPLDRRILNGVAVVIERSFMRGLLRV